MKKIYFIVLDGAADRSNLELDNKTPLETAKTPYMDELVKHGEMSMIQILPEGYVPETDSGLMALLGYDPMKYYCGRGTLELIGRELYKNYKYYVGFRVNFASYNEEKAVLDRRTSRALSKEELQILTDEIIGNIKLDCFPEVDYDLVSFGAHRGILSFYSDTMELSGNVSNTDPGFLKKGNFSIPVMEYKNKIIPCVALDDTKAARLTAEIVNDFIAQCHSVLVKSKINEKRMEVGLQPCNWLIVRDGGSKAVPMPNFYEKFGKKMTILGELPCEKALAELIDAQFCYSQEFELQLDEEYLRELGKSIVKINTNIIFCHLKGPDEPGHDKKPHKKVEAIEKIDRYFIHEIVRGKTPEDIVVVTCDHATPCALGIHSNDKVPLLISEEKGYYDESAHFDEVNGRLGKCPVKNAVDVMSYVMRRE